VWLTMELKGKITCGDVAAADVSVDGPLLDCRDQGGEQQRRIRGSSFLD
jgi:hypothetical protein